MLCKTTIGIAAATATATAMAMTMTMLFVSQEAAAQPAAASRVEPFTVAVSRATLDDLETRLARTRWPDQLPGTGWEMGADTAYMRELADYWFNEYDWRAEEARLNGFDHYRAEIDGMRVHFVHAPSEVPDAIPLLMLHGWPSSFVQMLDIIPLLTDPPGDG